MASFAAGVEEMGTSAPAHFRIFHPSRLYGIHPSGVVRYRFGFLDLLDHQATITQLISRNAGLSQLSPPTKMACCWRPKNKICASLGRKE